MMDGDTHLEPGAISGALPFLRLEPPIIAMTTDEHVCVDGPAWIAEWLHLRHGLRDLYTSSVALSQRLLCLTGRFSVFRADALDDGRVLARGATRHGVAQLDVATEARVAVLLVRLGPQRPFV